MKSIERYSQRRKWKENSFPHYVAVIKRGLCERPTHQNIFPVTTHVIFKHLELKTLPLAPIRRHGSRDIQYGDAQAERGQTLASLSVCPFAFHF